MGTDVEGISKGVTPTPVSRLTQHYTRRMSGLLSRSRAYLPMEMHTGYSWLAILAAEA